MVTYRKELERRGWHRPMPVRVLLVVVGVFLVLFGLVGWSLEQEEGGWEGSGLGHFVVEEQAGHALVLGEAGDVLFEAGTIEEVDAWIESQRNRNFTVPISMIAGGGLLTVAGVAPSPRKRDVPQHTPPTAVRV